MNKRFNLFAAIVMLIIASLACAEKYVENTTVYAADSGPASKFYDPSTNKILRDDVWVFRQDGTFSAIVVVDSKRLTLSGKYGGDNMGDDFIYAIDTNGDGQYDDSVYASKDFSYIEWRRSSGILKYMLAP